MNTIRSSDAAAATWCCPVLNASVATGQLTVNPPTISFGEVLVGNSQTQSGTLTNSNGKSILQVGASGSEFQLSGLSLPTLTPGQSATFSVISTPTTGSIVVGVISVTAIVSSSEDQNINYNSALSIRSREQV